MRKLYALLAGLCFVLSATPAHSQTVPDIANFNFTIDASNNNVVFINTSVLGNEPGIRKAFWSFGDGSGQSTAPLQGTQHHYLSTGSYTVCLKIYRYFSNTNDSVLSAHECKTIVLETPCRADFEQLPLTTVNDPLHTTFKALPWHHNNYRPLKICWVFGDGKDTCIQYSNTYPGPFTVNHTYQSPGNYEVCVKIIYQEGCEARKCKAIQVARPDTCRADFEKWAVTTANHPFTIFYKALPGHSNNKKPAKICWSFGDGRDSCINYPSNYNGSYYISHEYPGPGLYEVCVKILYYGGCEARKCKAIRLETLDSCKANFEKIPNLTVSNIDLTLFRALPWHSNNKKPARICWTFGDGKDTCVQYGQDYTGQYVIPHHYSQPGTYEVCVKILYYGGCEARICKEIRLETSDSCKANFEKIPNLTVSNIDLTFFRALPWHSNNKKPARICWTFGDGKDTCVQYGQDYTGQYVIPHHYSHPGTYEVCVKILYYGGCEARICKPVTIPSGCHVNLHEIVPSVTSLVRGFYASLSSSPLSRPERICWIFGDGTDTCIMATQSDPPDLLIRHTYPAPGVYRACVRVLFANGCRAEDCHEVVIRSNHNVCGGFLADSMTAPRTFSFKGFAIHNPNDQVLSYRWSFGDGSTAMGREVSHTYTQSGDFEVCLYIRTVLGCETRICRTIRVPGNNQPALQLAPNPVVNILHATFLSTHSETMTIKLVNANGVVIRTVTRNAVVGINNWDFDVSNLLPGVYSLVVQSSQQLASAIFIKQ